MKRWMCAAGILILNLVWSSLNAQTTDIRVHDPVMIREGDNYYLFCTGRGISVFSSPDMKSWQKEDPVFERAPAWTYETVRGFNGHIWAPDIHFFNGTFYLYYSVSSFGRNTSAIGLVTNKTLDPNDPEFKWQDEGMIVQSIPGRDLWNAIDPNIVEDDDGYPWMTFGSFWQGIKLVRLTPNRISLAEPQEWYTIARRERSAFTDDRTAGEAAIEAPFIFKKDSMYYLFVSWDKCCRGIDSNYKVVVGRARNVNGPYLDRDNVDMAAGGGSLVIQGNELYAGAGHNSTYTFDGRDYLVFHAYDVHDDGRSKLKIAEISWDAEGWPVVDQSVLRQ